MSYSRRQLEALGEPLGESVTRKEGGRIIYGGGGGGGGGDATQTNVTDLPEWAKPTAQRNLAKAESLATDKPYQSYTNWAKQEGLDPSRVAGFNRLQNTAFEGAGNLQPSGAMGQGIDLAQQATQRALGTGYDAGQFQNQFQGPGAYQAGQFGTDRVSGPQLEQFQMGPAERVRADMFGGRQAAQYMSPYIEQALAPQLREAQRSSEMQRNADQARAVGMGAFGGSRQAIVEAERQRNLGTQMGDIRARGLQSAYEQATQQFNQDAARRMQAQQANQGAGLTVGQQNLAALLGVQQLGAGQNLQAQLANQQQGMEAQRLGEQSRQFGAGQDMTAAQQRAQFGQAAQQLTEQSRQYGAGLGLQGLQAAMTGAGQIGALGSQQFGQQKDVLGLQSQLGAQQQANEQAKLGYNMQDYSAAQQYPYQQLSFLSNIMRGTPMGGVSTMYGAQPTMAQNIGALGMGAYGVGQLMKAEGGTVSSYADGGSVDSPQNIESIVDRLSDPQLKQAAEAAQMRGDVEQLQIIQQEMASRASERNGMMGAFNQLPQEQQQQMMAGGGMVAFSRGGGAEEDDEDGTDRITQGLQGIMAPSDGNEPVYKQVTGVFPQLLANVAGAKYTPMSDAKYNEAIAKRRTMLEEGAGPSPYADIKGKIAAMRSEDEKSLSQGRGLAALQAAAALTQGRGLAQGLGRAGGAFAESYGKALQADSAQKRALMNMEINAADAMRKERMGLNRDAITAADQARKNHDAAQQFGIKKANALANVAGKFATATKPTKAAGSGAPKPLKLAEQLAAAEIAHETKPTETTLANVNALRRAMDRARTSDYGPTRAGQTETQQDIILGNQITTAQQKIRVTPEFLKADAAGKAQMLRDEAARVRANANKNAGVNSNSPRAGQNDYSYIWGGTGN